MTEFLDVETEIFKYLKTVKQMKNIYIFEKYFSQKHFSCKKKVLLASDERKISERDRKY